MQDDISEHDSDLDLDNNIKAIGGYVDDRETMIEHMFRSISKSKLHAMLPEILRVSDVTVNAGLQSKLYAMLPVTNTGCDVCVTYVCLQPIAVDELKRLCVEEVEVMSRKRILRIVDGKRLCDVTMLIAHSCSVTSLTAAVTLHYECDRPGCADVKLRYH